MNKQAISTEHPPISCGKVGILLVNLGTPDSTSWWDIRRYLKEFLSDRRVIEVPKPIWWFILNGPILTFRPAKTARAYRKIWRQESDESPLRFYTRQQAEKLAAEMAGHGQVVVDWAMRYGNPSIDRKVQELQAQGCQKLVVVPLYPQYAAATTASACDAVFRSLMRLRWQPTVRIADPYDAHPLYIQALANSIQDHCKTLDEKPDVIVASYHGIPKKYFEAGDPYHCYCHKTTRLLREALGVGAPELRLTFQSRFGPAEWLQPYTDETLVQLAKDGVKRVAVLCPGFAADCVETLEEIAMESRKVFLEAGGEAFSVIPCLNDRQDHILLLKQLAEETAAGWLEGEKR